MNVREAWEERKRLNAAAENLDAVANKLWQRGIDSVEEGVTADKYGIWAIGHGFAADAYRLRVNGDLVFMTAVIAERGSVKIEFKNAENGEEICVVDGEVFS